MAARECGKKKMTQEGARTEKAQNQRKPVSRARARRGENIQRLMMSSEIFQWWHLCVCVVVGAPIGRPISNKPTRSSD